MEKKRVCHFTSAHDSHDDRIFLKECDSLYKAGYGVYLVAKGEDCKEDGIKIIGCGNPKGRIDRMLFFSRRVYKKAKALDCDIYHFHDPELLPYGVKLSKKGKKVIFDSHEDVPAQILDKYWIPKPLRRIISAIYKYYESYAVKHFDVVITATEHIANCFKSRAKKIVVINNYPKLDDILFHSKSFSDRKPIVCYAGGISEIRGEKIMIEAMKDVHADLILAGKHDIETCENGESNIQYIGQVNRDSINALYGRSMVGILLYQPAKNHFEAQPIKMFEYMAAGLPVVASNFPLWRKIIERNNCGICVDCKSSKDVSNALERLLNNPQESECMGKNGRDAVEKYYNWEMEEKKLLNFYKII